MSEKVRPKTVFSVAGELHEYDGSLFTLRTNITSAMWAEMVESTVDYHSFLVALREFGCNSLGEKWTDKDEAVYGRLDRTVEQIREADPLLLLKADGPARVAVMKESMARGSMVLRDMIYEIQAEGGAYVSEL